MKKTFLNFKIFLSLFLLVIFYGTFFSLIYAQQATADVQLNTDVTTTIDGITDKTEPWRIRLLDKVTIEKEKILQSSKEPSFEQKPQNNLVYLEHMLLLYMLSIAIFIIEHAWLFYSLIVIIILSILSAFFK